MNGDYIYELSKQNVRNISVHGRRFASDFLLVVVAELPFYKTIKCVTLLELFGIGAKISEHTLLLIRNEEILNRQLCI